jgi:hypothetical protein
MGVTTILLPSTTHMLVARRSAPFYISLSDD